MSSFFRLFGQEDIQVAALKIDNFGYNAAAHNEQLAGFLRIGKKCMYVHTATILHINPAIKYISYAA